MPGSPLFNAQDALRFLPEIILTVIGTLLMVLDPLIHKRASNAFGNITLVALVAAYAGTKIRLVCDNGRFHTTQAVQAWLHANRDKIAIFWLPPYCPSLNLIERLWGHLKRTVLANVLFETIEDLVAAFVAGVRQVNGKKDKMGFMFNHDDLRPKQRKAG